MKFLMARSNQGFILFLPQRDEVTLNITFYLSFFFLIFIYLFIHLTASSLSCGMWDLLPCPGIEPWPPALGAWNLSHWTTREVPST